MAWQRESVWHRLDERGNEHCVFVCGEDTCVVEGIGVLAFNGSGMVFEYHLEYDEAWNFESAVIVARVGEEEHTRLVERTAGGEWYVDGAHESQFSMQTDLDLSFSPSTNTTAIRRLSLEIGAKGESRAILVSEPTLTLSALSQTYRRRSQEVYDYAAGDLKTAIRVDSDGIVVDYAGHFVVPEPQALS